MAEARDQTTSVPESSSSSGSDGNGAGDFECNICFDLAQDPVITLCGHLYCWPCLYRWLRGHSQSQECPVCKALIQEEKVIPLYGRGKQPTDPRSKPVPGVEIPNRPAGQRAETVPPSVDNNFANLVLGLMGGFIPIASATFSNIGMYAGFGGMFSPFFSVQFNGFPNASGYGGSSGYDYGYTDSSRDSGGRSNRDTNQAARADDENLKKILLVILVFVLLTFLTM
ncbi:putative E3 ubiquitin ligase [Handroanthus impetiginosus]|uniref:E3 ubiquitin-protein ligase RMA n=1 Tax=Handroanthus impetiginosus TaxID=429701 RepID=A0A2G9GZ11_9LAMI|nr:putative E3 ubiquitin ligase [Handroanthus impetiginosus]